MPNQTKTQKGAGSRAATEEIDSSASSAARGAPFCAGQKAQRGAASRAATEETDSSASSAARGAPFCASPKKAQASRANARKSTGPRTAAGKAASRNNAYKHGMRARSAVAPGEDQAEFDALLAKVRAQFNPQTPTEEILVQQVADASWRRDRLKGMESALLGEPEVNLADLDRISRWQARMENSFFKAYNELRRIIQSRNAARDKEAKEASHAATPKSGPPGDKSTPEECVYWWDPVTNKRIQIAGPPEEYDPAREIGPHKNNIPYSDPSVYKSNRRKF